MIRIICYAWLALITGLPLSAPPLLSADEPAWQTVKLKDFRTRYYGASSKLGPSQRYAPDKLLDRDPATCWCEGVSGDGIGQSIIVSLPRGTKYLALANGYQKSRRLFEINGRVKRLGLTILAGLNRPGHATEYFTFFNCLEFDRHLSVPLADRMGYQRLPLAFDWQRLSAFGQKVRQDFRHTLPAACPGLKTVYLLKMTVENVYPGRKYHDTCLSEIMLSRHSREIITKIYTNTDGNTLMADSATQTGIVLEYDPESVFQIVDITPDNRWLIIIRMEAGSRPRSATDYLLYQVSRRLWVPPEVIGPGGGEMLGFSENNHKVYLDYLETVSGDKKSIDLDMLYKMLEHFTGS